MVWGGIALGFLIVAAGTGSGLCLLIAAFFMLLCLIP
jgi:hypothetical protein